VDIGGRCLLRGDVLDESVAHPQGVFKWSLFI
jgi:hypothetical protein